MEKINFTEKLNTFSGCWHAFDELKGQHVKVVKLQGEFIWHLETI